MSSMKHNYEHVEERLEDPIIRFIKSAGVLVKPNDITKNSKWLYRVWKANIGRYSCLKMDLGQANAET